MNACTCAQYSTIRRGRVLGRAAQQVDVVRAHPGVQRHVVGALEHVDRVDLEHAGALEGALEGAHRGRRVRLVEEALGGERDPARLRDAQRLHAREASHDAALTARALRRSRQVEAASP